MGILNPAALPFVSLLGVLVLIYLRQRTRTRIEVPSLLFWADVPEDRVRSRRFRPDLLFFLQVLLLLLLIGGLLHPYWSRAVTETRGDRQILVFDLSASMQARENGVRRFDLALDQAKNVLHALAPLDEVMLIGIAARPQVISGFTTDHRLVLHRLESLRPQDTGTQLELGIELALVQRDRAGRQAQIHVFTDLSSNQLSLSETQQQALTYHRVGETDDNMALASVHVYQNPFQDYSQAQAYILVRNYANRTKTATLRVELNGQAAFQEAFSLSANDTRSFSLSGFTGPGQLAVHLESEDALAVDNHALNWVAARRSTQLVLVSPVAHLHQEVRQLSQALPGVTLRSTRPEDFSADQVGEQDVVLFHQFVPDEAVPANSLYIFPPVENTLFPVLTEAADLTILDWNDEHEILHNLQYVEALPFKQARILALPSWAQVLISSKTSHGEIPLALTGERDGRRLVCLAFDLDAGNLTDSDNLTLLVLFLNALRWLRPPNPLDPQLLPAGDVFFLPTDAPLDGALLSAPQTEAQALETDTVSLDRVGIYRVETASYRAELYANLFDEAESNIGRQTGDDTGTVQPAVSPGVRTSPESVQREIPVEFGQNLYWLAALLLFAEWLYALWRSPLEGVS
ncbi:MAG: BatA and WFA domain-containing protein [Desulfurellaceae bacterium]|nr:BatA and WFA domain-containing protein [Desulfurellaceae bacterium]